MDEFKQVLNDLIVEAFMTGDAIKMNSAVMIMNEYNTLRTIYDTDTI